MQCGDSGCGRGVYFRYPGGGAVLGVRISITACCPRHRHPADIPAVVLSREVGHNLIMGTS